MHQTISDYDNAYFLLRIMLFGPAIASLLKNDQSVCNSILCIHPSKLQLNEWNSFSPHLHLISICMGIVYEICDPHVNMERFQVFLYIM